MNALLFALVDAALWSQWRSTFARERRRRANARRIGDRRNVRMWGRSMRMVRLFAFGWWRSLWPLGAAS